MRLLKISIFIGIFILLSFKHDLYAYSEVSGIQSGIWYQDKSPYIVKNDILVPKGLVLKIEQGVFIKFDGNFKITVNGALIANGDKTKPIVFTSVCDNEFGGMMVLNNKMPQASDWKGIEFLDSCDDYLTMLNHCIIRYSDWAIRCSKAHPLLTNIMLVDNEKRSLFLNNEEFPFEPHQIISPISNETRPSIAPLPEPLEETDLERVKRLVEQQKQIMEQEHLKALQDSVRKANKVQPLHTKTGSINIQSELFDQFNFHNINDLISFMPGFLNMATIWIGYQLSSRGIPPTLTNNRVLFQLEGIPYYEPATKTSYPEFIPLDDLERIEINRGIVLTPFNHCGIIGSVDFIPRYDTAKLFNKSKIEFGEYGTKKLTTFLGLNRDHTFINISTNFMTNSGYWRTFPQKTEGPNFRQKYASDRYYFSVSLKRSSLNLFTSYFEHDQFHLGLTPQLQSTCPIYRRGLVFSLNKEIQINPQLHSRIIGNYVHISERSEIEYADSFSTEKFAAAEYLLSKGNLAAITVLTQYLKPQYLATAGMTITRFLVDPLFMIKNNEGSLIEDEPWIAISKILYYENTGFLQIGYNFSPFVGFEGKTNIYFADSFNRPDFSFDGKIIYNPFLPFDSYLKYAFASRSATLMEKRVYLPDLVYGKPDLKNEKFEQWEWCADIHIKRDLTCGFVLYQSKNSFLIQLTPNNAFNNNHKTFTTTGYEFMLQGKINDRFYLLTNIAYNRGKSSGWFFPQWKINGITKIHWFQSFSTITSIQYLSQLNTDVKLGPYYLVNLSLAYQLFPKIKIALNGFDLLDQQPENLEYIRNEIPAIPAGSGRSFYITMSIELTGN